MLWFYILLLKHGPVRLRVWAARCVGRYDSDRTLEVLVGALSDRDRRVRQAVGEVLSTFKQSEVVVRLGELLPPQGFWIREDVIYLLGRIATPDAAGIVTQALADERLRHAAAEVCTRNGWRPTTDTQRRGLAICREDYRTLATLGPAGVKAIVSDFHKESRSAKVVAAVKGLREPDLVRAFAQLATADSGRAYRKDNAATVLVLGYGELAIPPLVDIVAENIGSYRHVANTALNLLGRIGRPEAIRPLADLLWRCNLSEVELVKCLRDLGWQPESPQERVLVAILDNCPQDVVRVGPVAVEALHRLLDLVNIDVLSRVITLLARFGNPASVPLIAEKIHKSHDRSVAVDWLRQLRAFPAPVAADGVFLLLEAGRIEKLGKEGEAATAEVLAVSGLSIVPRLTAALRKERRGWLPSQARRQCLLRLLCHIGSPDTVSDICDNLCDCEVTAVVNYVRAVGASAEILLCEQLRSGYGDDADKAMRVLKECATLSSLPYLIGYLSAEYGPPVVGVSPVVGALGVIESVLSRHVEAVRLEYLVAIEHLPNPIRYEVSGICADGDCHTWSSNLDVSGLKAVVKKELLARRP